MVSYFKFCKWRKNKMIDLRRYANKDLISELSIIGLNNYEEGLSKFLSLIRYSKKVGGDQFNGISVLGNYANEVGRDQLNVISVLGNYANKVGRTKITFPWSPPTLPA